MNIQYISDNLGNPTAVIIPIEDWKIISKKLNDSLPDKKTKTEPSDFVGILSKETAQKMIFEIQKSRREWEKNI
jgi:hypothetical protein